MTEQDRTMIRMLLLPLLLAALLTLAAVPAAAVPLAFDRDLAVDARPPGPGDGADERPIARVPLLTRELVLLPSGRLVLRTASILPPRPLRDATASEAPLILPLPGAMPLFVAALAGLVLVARRRRAATPLAATGDAS